MPAPLSRRLYRRGVDVANPEGIEVREQAKYVAKPEIAVKL
jgi:hypothetical protein